MLGKGGGIGPKLCLLLLKECLFTVQGLGYIQMYHGIICLGGGGGGGGGCPFHYQ